MLVSLNKGTAAMLVSPTNPLGIELYSYANVFFCFALKNMLIDNVSENTINSFKWFCWRKLVQKIKTVVSDSPSTCFPAGFR